MNLAFYDCFLESHNFQVKIWQSDTLGNQCRVISSDMHCMRDNECFVYNSFLGTHSPLPLRRHNATIAHAAPAAAAAAALFMFTVH